MHFMCYSDIARGKIMDTCIKELPKKLDLDQTEFGNRIRVKQGSVSAYGKGIN